jgi:hypothetical protein
VDSIPVAWKMPTWRLDIERRGAFVEVLVEVACVGELGV